MNKSVSLITAIFIFASANAFARTQGTEAGSTGRFQNNSGVPATEDGSHPYYGNLSGERENDVDDSGAFYGGAGITGDEGRPDAYHGNLSGVRDEDTSAGSLGRFENNAGIEGQPLHPKKTKCYAQDSQGNLFQGRTLRGAHNACRFGSRLGGCVRLSCG